MAVSAEPCGSAQLSTRSVRPWKEHPVQFEWDPRKAAANLKKHGVSLEGAATAFRDSLAATARDPLAAGIRLLPVDPLRVFAHSPLEGLGG